VPGIVGFGAACDRAQRELEQAHARHARLRERLWDGIREALPDAVRNGAREHSLAHTLNVSFAGASGEALVEALDLEGIAVATGAACHAGSTEPSHVLSAMGLSPELGASAIRFSLGPGIDDAAIARVLDVLPGVVARVRQARAA
jgi:cysteine desulfurase